MIDVTALGELLIDFTPCGKSAAGQRIFEQNPGGAPANVLACLSKCGKKTAFIGKVGQDMHGQFLKDVLEENCILTQGLMMDETTFTTLAFVALAENGERSFSFARKPGADTCLRDEEIDETLICNSRIFHIGSLSLTAEPVKSATFYALQKAKEAGCIISYDPNFRKPLWDDEEKAIKGMRSVLEYVDLMKLSEEETVLLTGEETVLLTGEENPEKAAKYLVEKGITIVVVTLGEKGCIVGSKEGCAYVPGFHADVVDSTGAGDSFWGGFLNCVLESGKPITEMTLTELEKFARFGNAVASLCVEKRGAIPAMPTYEEILERLRC